MLIQPNNIQSVKSLIYFISNKKINKKISNGHKMIKEKFNSDISAKFSNIFLCLNYLKNENAYNWRIRFIVTT